MKTEKDILNDITILEKEQEENRKNGLKVNKINKNPYLDLIKIVKNLGEERVKDEYRNLIESRKKIEGLFDKYFNTFNKFRLKNEEAHLKAVKKEFRSDYEIPKLNKRIKRLEYLLDLTDNIKIS